MPSLHDRVGIGTAAVRRTHGGPLGRVAAAMAGLDGGARRGAALLLGALAAAALPPFDAVPVLLISFTGLLWLLDGATRGRQAFWLGWWFGLGHMVAGLYWIAISFSVLPGALFGAVPYIVLGMVAVVALAAGLALFPALAALAVHLLRTRGAGRVLALATAWAGAEWLRGHVLTGFPWNLAAYAWDPVPEVAQTAAHVGAYGLTLVTVALAASPATLGWRSDGWRCWATPMAAAAVLGVLWLAGSGRMASYPPDATSDTTLRVVQGNIAQSLKWRREQRDDIVAHYIALSRQPGHEEVDAVIWPETASPWPLWGDRERLARVAAAAPPDGVLITGANRLVRDASEGPAVWNSLHAIDPAGVIVANYDKHHLVPFGEYVPLRETLDIGKMTHGAIDFSAGPGPRTLDAGALPPFSPLICYEAIFPGEVVPEGPRPAWLLNVTNDAWFGMSSGPYQHMASARMRTIEEGLPLVRAANTGISAVVDPVGRITAQLSLGREGVIDATLPRALPRPPLYAQYGDWLFAILIALSATGSLAARRAA